MFGVDLGFSAAPLRNMSNQREPVQPGNQLLWLRKATSLPEPLKISP